MTCLHRKQAHLKQVKQYVKAITEPYNALVLRQCQTDTNDLQAWEAAECLMMRHDVGTVKKHADDADTLLVFVSLTYLRSCGC